MIRNQKRENFTVQLLSPLQMLTNKVGKYGSEAVLAMKASSEMMWSVAMSKWNLVDNPHSGLYGLVHANQIYQSESVTFVKTGRKEG